jgi:helix-turn-helix protein
VHPDEIDEIWNTAQVSRRINTPVATLRWWRHTGVGPKAFRLGARKVMYRRSDVEAWLARQYQGDGAL